MFVEGGGKKAAPKGAPADEERFAALDDDLLEDEIGRFAAHIASATCRWLLMIAEFERRKAHEDRGFHDAVPWLAWRCSIARRTAFENLRVARALRDLPRITAAFSRGHLSYSKVRALTRVADEENEQELLELALEATAAQLDRIVNGYRRVLGSEDARQIASRRHVALAWQADGSLRLNAELPAEEGALLAEALEVVKERLDRDGDARSDKADALMGLVGAVVGTDADPLASAAGPRESEVVVHVDLDDLSGDEDAGASNGSVEPVGQPLAPSVVKRLACDGAVVSIFERDGEPLSVGRRTRAIPPAIGRALRARDKGCCFPGCDRTRFIDAHHLVHWADGGETKLSNLVQLCRRHHRLVHEGRASAAYERDRLVFRDQAGEVIPNVPPLDEGSAAGCRRAGRRSREAGDPWDIAARSRGAPFDLGLTVAGLMLRRDRRAERRAEVAPPRAGR